MENKCSKFESLFIFSDNETLQNHIKDCAECKAEAENQEKVSALLDEVKIYYKYKSKQRQTKLRITKICASFFVMVSLLSVGLVFINDDLMDTLQYGNALSAEDLGFPVDSYGLLMVDE